MIRIERNGQVMKKLIYELYTLVVGIEPSEDSFNRTIATANYLKDNGYSTQDILKILKNTIKNINKDTIDLAIRGEDLPEELWDNSLLEKNKFYYSDILHIKSKAPSWNPITFKEECEPFFLEMKINFTIDDLLIYYYDKCRVPQGLKDDKKNAGAFKHLIKKYDAFNNVPGLDYVLALIDKASKDVDKNFFTDVFEIENYNKEVIEEFTAMYEQAVFEKTNVIVWRN